MLASARLLMEELAEWHETYKTHSQQAHIDDDSFVTCLLQVELGHHYVRLNVFRAILRRLSFTQETNGTHDPSLLEAERSARLGAHACSTSFLAYIRSLSQNVVQTFWPYWAQPAFSSLSHVILLMAITSPSYEEALKWAQDLKRARKELKLKASMHSVFLLASIRIDSIFWKDITKVLHLKPHVMQALDLEPEGLPP